MFNWKYRYFKEKLRGVEKLILDLEFKRFKTREIREELRVEYDNLKNRLSVLLAQIENEKTKPTMPKEEAARLDDQKVLMERDLERYLNQMKGLDLEVEGSKPTSDYPEGVQGITQQIESFRELKDMVQESLRRKLWTIW